MIYQPAIFVKGYPDTQVSISIILVYCVIIKNGILRIAQCILKVVVCCYMYIICAKKKLGGIFWIVIHELVNLTMAWWLKEFS